MKHEAASLKALASTLAVAVVATVGAFGAVRAIDAIEQTRATARIDAARGAIAARIDEQVQRTLGEIELTAHSAASHPRLVAAIGGDVGRSTLRDIFDSEPWWQPFRETFESHTFVGGSSTPEHVAGRPIDAAAAAELAATARARGRATARLVGAADAVQLAAAVPMAIPNRTPAPVLVLARAMSAADLGRIAEQTGDAVLLARDGKAIVGAGRLEAIERLRAAARSGELVSRKLLARGIELVAAVPAPAAESQLALTFALLRVAACVIAALVLALVVVALASRRGPARPAAQTVIGKYQLLDRIGGGGMAEVHLAVVVGENGFRRPCVVKRLRPELATNPLAVAQFTDEARLASTLVHPNIVPIFDFGRADDQYFLVEDYVVGRDLGRVVRRLRDAGRPALPPGALAFLACQVLDALDYAHHKAAVDGRPMGLVHRDVSPENVIVSMRGEVKLLDFGVLKTTEGRATKTEFGALKGNVTFMSPEQARGWDVDARADLFSLALVLYFCARGEPLYDGTGSYQLLVKAGGGVGPAEQAKLAALPEPFATVLRKALAPRLEDRYEDASAFARDLRPYADADGAALAEVMRDLFAAELRQEQHALLPGHAAGRTGTLTDSRALPTEGIAAGEARG